jgi:hypothetical protein
MRVERELEDMRIGKRIGEYRTRNWEKMREGGIQNEGRISLQRKRTG